LARLNLTTAKYSLTLNLSLSLLSILSDVLKCRTPPGLFRLTFWRGYCIIGKQFTSGGYILYRGVEQR
jgi:hypothetical protein